MKSKNKPAQRAKDRLPRQMWADYDPSYPKDVALQIHHSRREAKGIRPDLEPFPVHVLDASPEAHELRVEAGAKAMYINERRHESMKMTWETTWAAVRAAYRKDARAVLATVYDPPVGKGRGK